MFFPAAQRVHTHSVRRVGEGGFSKMLILGTVLFLALVVLIAPLVMIFAEAFRKGIDAYLTSLVTPDTLHAILLTVITAIIVVPINIGFGLAAAWAVTKFRFPGRNVLIALIELPFSVSPIIAGVSYLFVYGAQGLFGPMLDELGIKIMFSLPAIVLASMFVTAPFVARELIPLMQVQGTDQEEAAMTLGAGGFLTFVRVTIPNVRWALLYGAILCNARVMGEFGAVSVVSGNVRGVTNTLPLQVQLLYEDYNAVGAFAAATVLAAIALLTIVIKTYIERNDPQRAEVARRVSPRR